jgi:hypothetical protein
MLDWAYLAGNNGEWDTGSGKGLRAATGWRRGAMSRARIHLPQETIEAFCRRHGIRRLSLFGSVLRDDFRPDSGSVVRGGVCRGVRGTRNLASNAQGTSVNQCKIEI